MTAVAPAPPPARAAEPHAVPAGGVRWHVQRWPASAPDGTRPLLLLHGTGACCDSWAALAPLLATRCDVLAVDLPGHARSGPLPSGQAPLPGMAAALAALLKTLQVQPHAVLGHSAGAAVMLRLALDDALDGHPVLVGLNAALQPFEGWAGLLLPPLARLLSKSPLVPSLVAWQARDSRRVQRLIDATGSQLDEAGIARYAELVRNPRHVAGALAMTAGWDLHALQRDLSSARAQRLRLHLLVGTADRTVPAQQAERLAQRRPGVTVHRLPGLGHLAHEEAPQAVAAVLHPLLAAAGGSPGPAHDGPTDPQGPGSHRRPHPAAPGVNPPAS